MRRLGRSPGAEPGYGFRSNPIAALRLIWNEQVVRRGYGDIGYNFAIDAHGTIYEGRWARDYQPGELHDGEDANGLGQDDPG